MPELPEVETTLRGIEPWLLGKTIARIRVHHRGLRWPVPESIHRCDGASVIALRRRAKYLIVETSGGTIIIHLGMSGSLRVIEKAEPKRKHDHVEFELDDGAIIRYHDPRRFGTVLWTDQPVEDHELLSKLGPEPLGNAFNGEHLFRMSRRKKVAVKNFLMDNHVVVGVGNIYANEALFIAGIRPAKAASRITRNQYLTIADTIRKVLSDAIRMGGTTLRDFVNSSGEPGYFQQTLNVYGRAGEPCRHCNAVIKQRTIGQRSSFYCPACQR
jgi:formamidopyrimidine-DNA glycosylase